MCHRRNARGCKGWKGGFWNESLVNITDSVWVANVSSIWTRGQCPDYHAHYGICVWKFADWTNDYSFDWLKI